MDRVEACGASGGGSTPPGDTIIIMEINLNDPIDKITGIGPVFLKKLQKMGIKTIEDLVFHFPHRYEDFSNIKPVSKLKANENACVAAKLINIENTRAWKRKITITQAIFQDKTGAVRAVWFNQPYLIKNLKQNENFYLAGKVSFDKNGLFFSNPAYEKYFPSNQKGAKLTHLGQIAPIYPETEGLSSRWFRYILKPLLEKIKSEIPEIIPKETLKKYALMPISQAIWQIHFPFTLKLAEAAKKRFSFQELFLVELLILKEKLKLSQEKAISIPINVALIKKFVDSLPFKLTDAQKKATWRILKDLDKEKPMSRLLQGDVGSGKTIVALIASLNVAKAGYQIAFMAPTEILAKQHFKEAAKLLTSFKIRTALLTGKENKIISQKLAKKTKNGLEPEILDISRNKVLDKARKGEIDLLIGTHSLIQDKVKFKNLAFVIVDEQHRFGIKQRRKMVQRPKQKNTSQPIPHFLSMTATPIPRSLALTIYGDLDLSLIDEMPKGRKKVITKIVPPKNKEEIYNFIRKEIKKGRQAFIICPRIEANNKQEIEEINQDQKNKKKKAGQEKNFSAKDSFSWTEVKTVKEEYEKFSQEIFPDLKVEMLHGKMKPKEKEKIMQRLKNKKIDILVSTSVIEVGIDVPNASLIVIEGAERFGLAQLHQFRGRVGRSHFQSYCFLLTDSNSTKTKKRLEAMIKIENGFELAQKDLEIRGPGSLYGVKQWGIPDLAMENLKNLRLVEAARESAQEILSQDPSLIKHSFLKNYINRLGKKVHLE